jgi:hypothetical protein
MKLKCFKCVLEFFLVCFYVSSAFFVVVSHHGHQLQVAMATTTWPPNGAYGRLWRLWAPAHTCKGLKHVRKNNSEKKVNSDN